MPDFVLRKAREIGEHAAANLRRALAAGVHFVAGSDAGTPFNPHDGFAYELELMQSQLGMSARDVLRAATRDAARLLRIDRGTLAVGAVADLVLLERDIDSDGRPYRAPRGVVRNGEIVSMRP